MVQRPGRHAFGTDRGRVALLTARDGLAAQAGHDLTIEVGVWSGELTIGEDGKPNELSVTLDLNSLVIIRGTGGIKPLTDRDRREIAVTASKVLGVERYPKATFVASAFEPAANGSGFSGGSISGSLTIRDISRLLTLRVTETSPEHYHATASVRQSEFGIKPYTAFLGALKVSDAVGIEVDVDLAHPSTSQDLPEGRQAQP